MCFFSESLKMSWPSFFTSHSQSQQQKLNANRVDIRGPTSLFLHTSHCSQSLNVDPSFHHLSFHNVFRQKCSSDLCRRRHLAVSCRPPEVGRCQRRCWKRHIFSRQTLCRPHARGCWSFPGNFKLIYISMEPLWKLDFRLASFYSFFLCHPDAHNKLQFLDCPLEGNRGDFYSALVLWEPQAVCYFILHSFLGIKQLCCCKVNTLKGYYATLNYNTFNGL